MRGSIFRIRQAFGRRVRRRPALCRNRLPSSFLCLLAALIFPAVLNAQSFLASTHLIDVRTGSELSGRVRSASHGGYHLSDGSPVSFQQWYRSRWTDLHLTMLTQISRNFGILWGFGTGEKGAKYRIGPSLKIGFITQAALSDYSVLSLSVTTTIGGMLKESTCIADYGDIGGRQTVNCRLAASTLPPVETLAYLFNDRPPERLQVILRYQFRF